MNTENIFEFATRNKLRFPYKGVISVEDLWSLNLEELDKVFKTINKDLKSAEEESLLGAKSAKNKTLEIKVEIIKYIAEVKKIEAQQAAIREINRSKKDKIAEIIAEKEDSALKEKSVEELKKLLQSIE